MSKKIKVLHIIDSFGVGGAEVWLVAATRYIYRHPELNVEFDFLATSGVRSIYDDEVLGMGARIFYIKYSFKNILRFRNAFTDVLSKHKYDVIHNHQDFVSGWHFLAACGYLPSLRISHLHNPYLFVRNYTVSVGRWLSFRLGRLLMLFLSSKITGTSNKAMDEYGYNNWPYRKKRINPLYCGFDVDEFAYDAASKSDLCQEFSWDEGACEIALFVGRIGQPDITEPAPQKNPLFAFELAKKLITDNSEWRFVFAGYKGFAGVLMEDELLRLGYGDKIKFVGVRKDIQKLMSASSVLIFPSKFEGLGMVVVEAQASGLPIIMSEAVPQEVVVCPTLVAKKDTQKIEEWLYHIKQKLPRQHDRKDYNSRVKVSPFSIQNSVRTMLNAYSQ